MSGPLATLLGFALGADTSPAAPEPTLTGYVVATWSDPPGRLVRMRSSQWLMLYLDDHLGTDYSLREEYDDHLVDNDRVLGFFYEDDDGIVTLLIGREEGRVRPIALYETHAVEDGVVVHEPLNEEARARIKWFILDVIGVDLSGLGSDEYWLPLEIRLGARIPMVIPEGRINKAHIATSQDDRTASSHLPGPRTLARVLDYLRASSANERDYRDAKIYLISWTMEWFKHLHRSDWQGAVVLLDERGDRPPRGAHAQWNRAAVEVRARLGTTRGPLTGLRIALEFLDRPASSPTVQWVISSGEGLELGRGNDPGAAILAAGLVIEEDTLDDWFDRHLDPGTLTFNPGAYYALEEELPITMPWEAFSEIAADLDLPPTHDWPVSVHG